MSSSWSGRCRTPSGTKRTSRGPVGAGACSDLETQPLAPTRPDGTRRGCGSLVRRGRGKQGSAASRGSRGGSLARLARDREVRRLAAQTPCRAGEKKICSGGRASVAARGKGRARETTGGPASGARAARLARRTPRETGEARARGRRASSDARRRIGPGPVASGSRSLPAMACRRTCVPIVPVRSASPWHRGRQGPTTERACRRTP